MMMMLDTFYTILKLVEDQRQSLSSPIAPYLRALLGLGVEDQDDCRLT
jgi:hypothetical protein